MLLSKGVKTPYRMLESTVVDTQQRRLTVLKLVALGLHNNEIAKKLCQGKGTIKTDLNNIFGSLEASNKANAVFIAIQRGIITVRDIERTKVEYEIE